MGNKTFIIGASGKIGRALYDATHKLGNTLGTSTNGDGRLVPFTLEAWNGFDFSSVEAGDLIYLTAAISSPDICSKEYDRAYSINVTNTILFIEQVLRRKAKVVFFSSDTVYGETPEPFNEVAPASPAGEYAAMKWAVEREFAGNPLFKAVRLSYVFFFDDSLTAYLRGCADRKEEAHLYDPFDRSIISRRDVVEALIGLLHHWDEVRTGVVNLGGPEVLSRSAFAGILKETTLPELRYRTTTPEPSFFESRPRRIAMQSPWLPTLLGRAPLTIHKAALSEQRDTATF